MSDKLILKDGSVINIEAGASLSSIGVVAATKEDMTATWDLFTNDNLKEVQVMNGEDVVIGEYVDLVLENETSTVQEDGTILTYFNLREKTEVERLREEVEALKVGQEIQDGAIVELAEILGGEFEEEFEEEVEEEIVEEETETEFEDEVIEDEVVEEEEVTEGE